MKFVRGTFFRLMSFMKDDSDPEWPKHLGAMESGYCMNCRHKRDCWFLTPNFGPLCEECITELETNGKLQ